MREEEEEVEDIGDPTEDSLGEYEGASFFDLGYGISCN